MSKYYISHTGKREVVDRKKIINGISHQVLYVYHLTSSAAYKIWEYISGLIFTQDEFAEYTLDEYVTKCSDQ